MPRRQEYRRRITKFLNFEEQIFSEFENLCKEERIYPSHKLQQLMLEELQKKAVGRVDNPLGILYGIPNEKPLQPTLEMWMHEVQAAKGNLDRLRQIEAASYTVHKEVMVSIKQEQNKRMFSK